MPGVVRVQASVVTSALDAFLRRAPGQERVVGTLLGATQGRVPSTSGVSVVTQCFAVPSREGGDGADGDVALGKEHHRQMKALMAKAAPQDVVVGMFAVSNGTPVDARLCRIHDFYRSECADPLLLVLDTSKPGEVMSAYLCNVLTLNGARVASEFVRVPVEVSAPSPQAYVLNLMRQTPVTAAGDGGGGIRLASSIEGLDSSVDRLLGLLEQVSKYVDDVVEGRVVPNPALGKKLTDILASVPSIPSESAFAATLNDMVMISYLSQLLRAQLVIAEKLGTVI